MNIEPDVIRGVYEVLEMSGGTATVTEIHEFLVDNGILDGTLTLEQVIDALEKLADQNMILYSPEYVWLQSALESSIRPFDTETEKYFAWAVRRKVDDGLSRDERR